MGHKHQLGVYVDSTTGEIFAKCDCGIEGPRLQPREARDETETDYQKRMGM